MKSVNSHLYRMHSLSVVGVAPEGALLRYGDMELCLPARECSGVRVGESCDVFLYLDSSGLVQATRRAPFAHIGQFACLKVLDIGPAGAFLEWGIPKDLLAPHPLQSQRMQVGLSYLVHIEVDERGRAVANGRIEECLDLSPPALNNGDKITLLIWQFTPLGAKVIVNDRYGALLYRDEIPRGAHVGTRLTGYLRRLRPDGKLDVSTRQSGAAGVDDSRRTILDALHSRNGFLPLGDHSSPQEIQQELGISKKSFKKAVGGLYRDGYVTIHPEGIKLTASRNSVQ